MVNACGEYSGFAVYSHPANELVMDAPDGLAKERMDDICAAGAGIGAKMFSAATRRAAASETLDGGAGAEIVMTC